MNYSIINKLLHLYSLNLSIPVLHELDISNNFVVQNRTKVPDACITRTGIRFEIAFFSFRVSIDC